MLKIVSDKKQFYAGDLVTLKGSRKEEQFCIISLKTNENHQQIAVLKALFNETHIIEKPVSELRSLLIKGLL